MGGVLFWGGAYQAGILDLTRSRNPSLRKTEPQSPPVPLTHSFTVNGSRL